ncbi:snRNA-activating protein complex subunit 3 isoform X2 [Anthonomus grandis grandis]|uniref:snRNA-activating protein complex subunit 3 isoform X2 n=1 Tax=Anthonomus grandis grandis TaxID=2921223 RepID=UPI0021667B2A|nr:snRNA-activating protein complex subunit 3 isoform X2 [Anthonomus grandis grandis]XP_050308752.1 snRNA-activating protein complex subunit 3 isoform X2 [Anthonomus grandis grandis]
MMLRNLSLFAHKLTVASENPKLPLTNIDKSVPETHPITDAVRHLSTVRLKEKFSKTLGLRLLESTRSFKSEKNPTDIKPGSTFIIKTLMHVPFVASNAMRQGKITNDHIRVQYDLELLATNTLLDLANAIKCPSDSLICKEVESIDVDFPDFKSAKDEYPSRFFFIEGVFYNDMTHRNSIDLSEVVRDWASKKNIGQFKTDTMNVRLSQLKPRFGYVYVYVHQANCEHILTFSDVRLAQYSDDLDSKNYPKLIKHKMNHQTFCFMCNCQYGFWLVANSDRLTQEKTLLCQRCCQSYMFLDGKKLGDFQLYPYYTEAIAGVIDGNEEKLREPNEESEEAEDVFNEWGYLSS